MFKDHKNVISNLAFYLKEFANLEKIVYLHNLLLSSVEYPNVRLIKFLNVKLPFINLFSGKERDYFSVRGVLLNKKAFCIGIAITWKKFLDTIGVKNKIVWGYVNSAEKGKIIHMWNIVYINQLPYHLDTTFDITRNPEAVKNYKKFNSSINTLPSVKSTQFYEKHFLVSDDKIQNSHLWNKRCYPQCKLCYSRDEVLASIESLKTKGIKFTYD